MLNDNQIQDTLNTFGLGYSIESFQMLSSVFAPEFQGELTQETDYSAKTRADIEQYFQDIAETRDWQTAEFLFFTAEENTDGSTNVRTTAIIDFADQDGVEQPTKFLAFDLDVNDEGQIIRLKSDATNIDPRLEWGAPADNCTFD